MCLGEDQPGYQMEGRKGLGMLGRGAWREVVGLEPWGREEA